MCLSDLYQFAAIKAPHRFTVQVCDARDDATTTADDIIKILTR